MRSSLCTLALVLPASVTAQGITLAEGDTHFMVRILQESDPTAPGTVLLQDAEFLAIEITGRTVLQDLDTTRPRRVRQNGLWRIELPGAARLFRYRRDSGQRHGFLSVPTSGFATVILEQDGVGVEGTESPFADRIAVAPDGLHAAVPLLDGGLVILDLAEGTHRLVPTSAPVRPRSLMVGTHAFFATGNRRLWRLPLEEGSPEDVSPPRQQGSALIPEMALSGDGSTLVFLYGPNHEENLWVLRGSGPPSMLPLPGSKYEEPGYLPEGDGHPLLLLNEDGTSLFYSDHSDRDEVFLFDLSATAPHHLTGDTSFQPYIGATILPFFRAGTLLVAIGDDQSMDWFSADATPGNVVNLTLTGPYEMPFGEGRLAPESAVLTPGGLLSTESTASGLLQLRCMTSETPEGQIVYDDLLGDLVAGSSFIGRAELLVKTSSGDRLLNGSDGTELIAAPAGIDLSPPARGPGNQISLFRATTNGLGAAVFRLADGPLLVTPAEPGLEQAVLTAGGGALLNATTLCYLAPRVLVVIPTEGSATTLVLSGAGS